MAKPRLKASRNDKKDSKPKEIYLRLKKQRKGRKN
jgi:hypothetical protein